MLRFCCLKVEPTAVLKEVRKRLLNMMINMYASQREKLFAQEKYVYLATNTLKNKVVRHIAILQMVSAALGNRQLKKFSSVAF